ncbi:PC-Esterase [Dillenia turbinata]|uniref:PC-Esterase n=1 Tax=Dillenia turbinata TaxID=194707 RepID=A0AAN8VNC8_9MAGN
MERQRSFSLKPTRFLVLSFSLCLTLIFFSFFSIWVLTVTPIPQEQTHYFLYNKSLLHFALKPSRAQTLTRFATNLSEIGAEDKILFKTHVRETANSSGFPRIAVPKRLHRWDESVTGLSSNFSEFGANDSILIQTHVKKSKISFGFTRISAPEGFHSDLKVRQENATLSSPEKHGVSSNVKIEGKSVRSCDVTKGKWVFDESYPLYTNGSCPFIDEGFNCESNGRLDKDYLKWRWEPQDCSIPRFNATKMLDLIQGKRLVFVGDSMNRNQWESMLCLLMGAIKDPRNVYETRGRKITKEKGNYCFRFVDYKCTIEFYVSHFLVHESKARIGKKRVQTLRIDTVDRSSSRWRGADILVFNTAHWWSHHKTKAGINYYQEGDQVHPHLDVSTAFRRALMTWASWVDKNINPKKTKVFFRSSAPSHFRGGQWNTGGHCREANQPLNETLGGDYNDKNVIVEDVIRQLKTPVTILNITRLSEYRIDGHPSIYGKKPRKGSSSGIQDCSHWCLPGVPDIWNEILYFHLQSEMKHSFTW